MRNIIKRYKCVGPKSAMLVAIVALMLSPSSYSEEAELARLAEGFECFPEAERAQSTLDAFLLSMKMEGRDTRETFGDLALSRNAIGVLADPEDSSVCAVFNSLFAESLANKQIDWDSTAHPGAYACDITYYQSDDLYFVVLTPVRPMARDETLIKVSTGLISTIVVYDSKLNKVGSYGEDGYERGLVKTCRLSRASR